MPAEAAVSRQIRFTPRQDDLLTAVRCVYVADNWRSILLASSLPTIGVFLLFAAFLYVEEMPAELWHGMMVLFSVFLVGTAVLMPLAFSRLYAPWVARRSLDPHHPIPLGGVVAWDAAGVSVSSELSELRIAFADCRRWREDRDGILLYQPDRKCEVLPKRVFERAQIDDLRSLAKQAGVRGA